MAHPHPNGEILLWFKTLYGSGARIILPEIADFELRRNLIASKLYTSLARLNELKSDITYQAITTEAMLKAAELWAHARTSGRSTADPMELDGDVILAAQAIEAGAIVATENVGHLTRYVVAKHWRDIVPTR